MSLFASLTTAITGLNAQQEAIGNISDNISNASTVGFKDIGTSFQSLVSESTPQINQPGGVTATPLYQNNVPGDLTPTGVNTNLAIVGNGFFQVKAPPPVVAQGVTPTFSQENLYTQAGDFQLNSNGYLVNSAGDYLTGYGVNPQTNVVNTSTTSPIQISALVDSPQATANFNLAANLPSSYAIAGTPGYTAPSPITEQIFDASGNAQTVTIQLNHTAANTWTADISSPNAIPPTPSQVTLTFGDGTTPYPGSPAPAPAADIPPAGDLLSIADSTPVTVPPTPTTTPSTATPATGDAAGFTLPLNFGSGTQPISFNLGNFGQASGVTGFADPNGVTVQTKTQDGVARGEFQSVSIDQNGFVDINYTNGQTKSFYQIPVVQFNAPDQLQRLSGSAYGATIDSGSPQVNPPGQSGGGTITPSEVEGSNVDIATEFTKLITAQQVYSANSKVITTADQLLTTVIGLIQ